MTEAVKTGARAQAPITGSEQRGPVAFQAESVLTIEQVATWLQVSRRQAERLHIPCLYLGTRSRRYLGKTVLEYLERKIA